MLQVLWGRVFIDPSKSVRHYTKEGRKINKASNEIIQDTRLNELIKNLPEFKAEIAILQYWAQWLGVRVHCSPKYHTERITREESEFC